MSLFHGPSTVMNGLVFYVDAANPRSYPGTGTTWFDLTRNNNNGSLVNGPTYTSGSNGYINLDGTNDYISVSTLSPGAANTSFSLGGWVYYNAIPSSANNHFIFTNYGDASHSGFYAIYSTTTGAYFWCRHSDGTNTAQTTTTSISSGQWYYMVAVRDAPNNQILLYINGTLTGSTTFSGTYACKDAGSYHWIGVHYNTYVINCRIGSAFCYDSIALTSGQITQNFNATRGRYGI